MGVCTPHLVVYPGHNQMWCDVCTLTPALCRLEEILAAAQPGQPIQKVLSPHCGESGGGGGGGGEGEDGARQVCSTASPRGNCAPQSTALL